MELAGQEPTPEHRESKSAPKKRGGLMSSIVQSLRRTTGDTQPSADEGQQKAPTLRLPEGRPGSNAAPQPQPVDPMPAAPPMVQRSAAAPGRAELVRRHQGPGFLSPSDLAVNPTPLQRVALIGSCMLEAWELHAARPAGVHADQILVNNLATLPPLSEEEIKAYDFQVVQLPIRSVLHVDELWHLPHDDMKAHEHALSHACWTLEQLLKVWLQWNVQHGLLTFVANFFVPQQNPLGRLFPRYDLRNPEYFVARINEHLEKVVRSHRNAYILDVDRLAASYGRRYTQDDSVITIIHGGMMPLPPENLARMEQVGPMHDYYDIRWRETMRDSVWAELVAMYRTIRQIDQVKLVVVDLDDTLWNGISGDMTDHDVSMVDGWPAGFAEALIYLKKRGVLLAILSKNEESRIREIWPNIYGNWLRLDDFAAIHINWQPKSQNMKALLEGMSLLPRSVVFIDDNPGEREAMQRAFPDMRIVGREPYYLRRLMLWSAETQVPSITEESGQRTEMMRAQLVRETERKTMSREQFLAEAAPRVTLLQIDDVAHQKFARTLELINKTNQFNTTGRRWKSTDFEDWFRRGGKIVAFDVVDKFTRYGLVGVVVCDYGRIEQWVMSCRILGYDIEVGVMNYITTAMRSFGAQTVSGPLVKTDANFPCRDLFSKCGFVCDADGQTWLLQPGTDVQKPPHVEFVL